MQTHPCPAPRSRSARLPLALLLCAAAMLPALGGCIIQTADPEPQFITVELVNTSGFVLDANFFRSGVALVPGDLFRPENIYTGYSSAPIPSLNPGQSVSFSLPCESVASLGVRRPVFTSPLTLTGGEAPEELFLRKAVGFQCDQTVRFVYTADAGEFHVAVQALP